ncbi:MAG: crossover junction endodeoxyribonuclease RuvC [Candidatus Paceibacterota bacterium]|jgi:crossover junction endodeoxyribonuclease RuvC
MIILGIDPGTATTGYGLIKVNFKNKNDLQCLAYGCITTVPGKSDGQRLKEIEKELSKIINKHKPDILAVERIFFFKNQKTIITVSQAKGVIILTAAKKKIPVVEYSPVEVKMAVSGYGRAEKKQIQRLIQSILDLDDLPKPDDAADALGIAICCSQRLKCKK